ncbi:hypothetical protein E4U19_000200 [Claviceps sp. Clav32 group G5]|nr:hypothetical protein E4U19_000200 [Claviceps sp. Clav32 group G5]
MADASCSAPSPFKRLVDHQSRDVSHHQDRLVDQSASQRHSPFRSTPQQGTGPDNFNAFIQGASMPGMPHDPANRLAVHASALQQPGGPMGYHHQHSALSQQATASPAPGAPSWATEFTRFSSPQHTQPSPNIASHLPVMQLNQQRPMQMDLQSAFGQAFGSPMYGGPAAGPGFMDTPQVAPEADFDKEMSQWMSAHGRADMSEVDAAMDQMARELELNEATLPADAEIAAAATPATASEIETPACVRYSDLGTPEIANLSLQDASSEQGPVNAPVEEAVLDENNNVAADKAKSAVSEAAERLLETVQHERGEKWKNSVFLSLMRDFRDGRKDIVGNEIRDTEGAGGGEHSGKQQQDAA